MKKIPFLTFFIALASCSPKSDLQTVEWRSGSSKESLEILKQVDSVTASEASVFSQKVSLRQQQIRGVPVEDTYIKEISSGSNQLAVRGRITTIEEKLKDIPLEEYLANKSHIEKRLCTSLPIFRKKAPLSVSLVIAHHKGFYQPLWKVLYVDNQGVTWEARFNNFLQIQKVQRVGSHFQDTLAWVFPKGSRKRELQEVVLSGLYANPTLANTRLMVNSQNTSKIVSVMEPLKFNNKDPRFDQVQAFYFLDESLSWFDSMLGFKIPFVLQAEVQVGFPEKTNSAFYYQGKIRLGAGDDEVYSHLAQDPSVVVHESVHALVDSIAGLPFEGEGGSLNEGFADFFTAAQLNNPNMGEASYLKGPFRRSVVNAVSLADKNGGLYHDSGIISGVLWDLKEQLGSPKGIRIAALTLARLVPGSDFKDFGASLRLVIDSELAAGELQAARALLQKRGF
ncbi:hypothetical protein [Bdellovibrio sp. HCB209]|uniref:hypothetical protein n=1 Tax=Bdellovibrio sp. HCB209 TaxID=3394354 RepID=UPI0039B38410